MSTCKTVTIPKRKVCIGDMRYKIKLFTRTLTAATLDSVDFGDIFSSETEVWAAISTNRGSEIFDGTNLIGVATHFFYIRNIAGVDAEKWVEYKSEYYDILSVENYGEDDRYLELACNIRGDKNKPVNLA